MITLRLAGADNVFLVPENRIRVSSEFVDAALRGPWQEAQNRIIKIYDFSREAFDVYFQWLVAGVAHSKLRPKHISKPLQTTPEPWACLYFEILALPELFHLGHYLLDTDFRDALSDALLQCASDLQRFAKSFPAEWGSKFYRVIPEGSPTRKLVVDLATWPLEQSSLWTLDCIRDCVDPDYTMDLLLAVAEKHVFKTPGKSPLDGWETSCTYHCHGNEKPCYRKRNEMSLGSTKNRDKSHVMPHT